MTFLEKLDRLMAERNINKNILSKESGIPYTTIDGFYKKGYQKAKIPTIQKLAKYFDTTLDYLMRDDITDINHGKTIGFDINYDEMQVILKLRKLDKISTAAVNNALNFEYEQSLIRAKNNVINTIKQYRISYFPEPVSAGTGQYLDYTSLQTLTINTPPPIGADFILRVIGDSMEPEYPDGGLVFVRIQKTIEIGDVGIFFSEGNVYMKVRGENGLESLNKKYPTIEGDKDIKCIGKVVGKLSWSNVVE